MSTERRKTIDALLSKYKSEPDFKRRLLDDPRAALSELGITGTASALEGEEECGGDGTCKSTCGGTCSDTCGKVNKTCNISL